MKFFKKIFEKWESKPEEVPQEPIISPEMMLSILDIINNYA